MSSISPKRSDEARRRQRLASEVRNALRELRIQLALLNYRVGSQVDLKDIELDCLDILDTSGPLSPSALGRRAGVHPATMTGILDRLERGGWVVRERDPDDRRAIVVRVLPDRYGELLGHYSRMARSMNKLLAGYSEADLTVIADFLRRTVEAGDDATLKLSESGTRPTASDVENAAAGPTNP
jgi:DNA-binding MarR family transcriptional regulator